MRVNVYAEEMTDRIEVISKEIEGRTFTGLRLYLELPVTVADYGSGGRMERQVRGPFRHGPEDDDSAAVTFWGKRDLRGVLRKALAELDKHYEKSPIESVQPTAIADIAAERHRQQDKEGWSAQHDDAHREGELAMAAASYAMSSIGKSQHDNGEVFWPFTDGYKPTYGRRDLIRAAALIVAEIERLDRATLAASSSGKEKA